MSRTPNPELLTGLRADERLLRDIAAAKVPTCPACGESMTFEPPRRAERETNYPAWRGGWACQCGRTNENEEVAHDDVA